jgi:thioredoxin-like negative regulator of GroEL
MIRKLARPCLALLRPARLLLRPAPLFSASKPPSDQFKQQAKQFYEQSVKGPDFVMADSAAVEAAVKDPSTPSVFYCSAEWCQPCKVLQPKLQAALSTIPGLRLLKIDIDKLPDVAEGLRIQAVPTVFLIHKGRAVDGFQGAANDSTIKEFAGKAAALVAGQG